MAKRKALELEVETWPGSFGSDFVVSEGEVKVEVLSYEEYGEGFVKRVRLVPRSDRVVVQHYTVHEPTGFQPAREFRTWYVYTKGRGWKVEKIEETTSWDELDRIAEEPEP